MFTSVENEPDDDRVTSIKSDVMRCLDRAGFFEKLDDILSPHDGSRPSDRCYADYRLSEPILRISGFDAADITDIFDVLRSQGGSCDCEILYNVAELNRLKAQYWREQARTLRDRTKHVPHSRSHQG